MQKSIGLAQPRVLCTYKSWNISFSDLEADAKALLQKIDELEQQKLKVSEKVIQLVQRRTEYPSILAGHLAKREQHRLTRTRDAPLELPKLEDGEEREKLLASILKMKEFEEENKRLTHQLETRDAPLELPKLEDSEEREKLLASILKMKEFEEENKRLAHHLETLNNENEEHARKLSEREKEFRDIFS
ncbi:unnamed protein product [Gongylonema pulchrum]|uniref:RH2 domain-containing protein n=1 Tax=Gongylonema pulchrum TaxID=637853 RepID=A0A183DT19_9BILA|nr:unnamed protein product [Gongylonema pulchrum]